MAKLSSINKNNRRMKLSKRFLNKRKKGVNYSLVGFNENGNSLKGIDV